MRAGIYTLFRAGIQSKMLRIVKCMYEKVKSCVKSCNNFSDFLGYSVGLRQWEVISLVLVSLFLEDLELYLQKGAESGYKARFIANSSSCTTTELSKLLTSCLTTIKNHAIKYCEKVYERSGKNLFGQSKIHVRY